MRWMSKYALVALSVMLAEGPSVSQEQDMEMISFLEGIWTGSGDGFSGSSSVTQTFEPVLGDNFLRMQTRSEFPPQERNPEGEIHEDIAIFSFDRSRNLLVMRAFYIEGFVNRYVLSEVSDDGDSLVFVTEAVENAPAGTQAKLVLKRTGEDALEEGFYVSFPGKEFSCYSTSHLVRRERP